MNNFFFVLPEESGGAPFVGESQTLLFREREDVFVSRDSSSVCALLRPSLLSQSVSL